MTSILRRMFGLDYRSLALLRIGLAAMTLVYLGLTAQDLRAFYTDEGVFPRSAIAAGAGRPVHSLYMLDGSVEFAAALVAIHAVLALAMLVGWRTRVVTIACYVMLQSLHLRNQDLLFGADISFRVCFFWAMFLPLGRRFSLDALRTRPRPPEAAAYLRLPGVAYLVQFAMIYLFSYLLKTGPTWLKDHTAVYYALSIEAYQRPLGVWLRQHDDMTAWLTVFTLYAEKYGPWLLILPVWSGWARLTAILLFAILQLGFNLTMEMGFFGPVMIVVSLGLLPAEFWSCFAQPATRALQRCLPSFGFRPRPDRQRDTWDAGPEGNGAASKPVAPTRSGIGWRKYGRILPGILRDATVGLLSIYAVLWNTDTLPGRSPRLPEKYQWIGRETGLNQLFDLFTPDPGTSDGWFVIEGVLKNGAHVNAYTGARTVSYEKPANLGDTYGNQRWGALFICLWHDSGSYLLEPFAEYLGREWNRTHQGDEEIQTLFITFMRQNVGPRHTHWPLEEELLWTQTFE